MTAPTDLPPGLVAYRRTPVFNEHTIPDGLRREHRTKPGVWAVISILEGRLRFRSLAPHSDARLRQLSAGDRAVVAPEEPHEVEADGTVRFFVEFYRPVATDGGAG